ncbi:hypothetical protein IMCC20628_01498 [Hoeflea sp. IMCC20628]|uniref:hypothetical protein n=1 Tax=Hoeflea sp. IMCC20628 TaxID=1620421 RepID=UPI00063AE90B|nr:hypothetical protein [Hoeflea sp. IMCC20628]AKI00215.1 hypothetical protein IMCC20628_01498 [Hoeflea sp. IMCC20628]
MLRILNPAYLQLAAVLLFPSSMIANQLIANTHALYEYAHPASEAVVHLSVPYSPTATDAVLSNDDRVWTGEW